LSSGLLFAVLDDVLTLAIHTVHSSITYRTQAL
jgi:hypothetical protein